MIKPAHDKIDSIHALVSTSPYLLKPSKIWFAEFSNRQIRCPECGMINADFNEPIDIVIDDVHHNVPKMVRHSVMFTPCSVYRLDVLKILLPYMDGFALGRCFSRKDDRAFSNYATVYAPKPLRVQSRGHTGSTYDLCSLCGVPCWGKCTGEPYCVRAELPVASVVSGGVGALYVCDPAILTQLVEKKIKGLRFERLAVVDTPCDGFPIGALGVPITRPQG